MSAKKAHGAAASRYQQLVTDRDSFANRADKVAKLTIPTIYRKDKNTTDGDIKDPAQTMGARGVNTLASKLVLSLLPTSASFFKLNISTVDENAEKMDPELRDSVLEGLGTVEREVLRDVENSGDVTVVYEMLKHLEITGNVLGYIGETKSRMYDLNKYVVVRSPDGEWLEIVICEDVSPASMEGEAAEVLKKYRQQEQRMGSKAPVEKTYKLYTHIKRRKGRVVWYQELVGEKLKGGDVPEEGNPWMPLRFIRVDGENYGRSYCEMYLGDLESLEVLTRAVNESSAAAAKVIFLVNSNGTTKALDISNAENLAVLYGNAADVTTLQLQKAADMSVAKDMIGVIERRLAFAFMINAEVMRDAERVTAEEIRYIAQELDASLGGVYSMLSQEFQRPYVQRRMHLFRKRTGMAPFPKEVNIAITTGFAALGKGNDSERILRFIEKVNKLLSNPALAEKINIDEAIKRIALSEGIETKDLLVPAQTQAANGQQNQAMAMMENMGPEVIKQAGPIIQQAMQQPPEGTPQDAPQAP
ncbi:MAG: portal protein [Pseudomonadota bacterium]